MEFLHVFVHTPEKGKEEAATKALIGLAEYLNKSYSGRYGPWEVCSSMDGPRRVLLIERWKSMTTYEEAVKAWAADPKSKEWSKESAGLFAEIDVHFYHALK